MLKKAKRLLKPSKKDDYGINLIFLAVDNNSEELLLYILAINNKSLTTSVSTRENLHKRLKQIGHYVNDKLVIPCILFSVLDSNNKLINKICPLPYRLMDTSDLENISNLHIYEIQTISDHLVRGAVFKQLEKIMRANKAPDQLEILDFITAAGTPNFKDKLEKAIDNFSTNCSKIRTKIKRTNLNIAQYLYNFDHTYFTREVQVCDYTAAGNFAANLETLCYNSGLGENTNLENKTYIVNKNDHETESENEGSPNTSTRIDSPVKISSSEEEEQKTFEINEVSETEEIHTSPIIAQQETRNNNSTEIIQPKNNEIADIQANSQLSIMTRTEQKRVSPEFVFQPESHPLGEQEIDKNPTNSEISADIQKHLGPNPFFYPNKPILRIQSPPKDICPGFTETSKLLENTNLDEDSIKRLNNAANLKPVNNELDTQQYLSSFDLDSQTPKQNEKSRVKFDSKNEYNYISDEKSSSLKKPIICEPKLNLEEIPNKIPQSIIKQPKIQSYTYKSRKDLVATPNNKFHPQGISTPYPKSEQTPKSEPNLNLENRQESIHVLTNDYSKNSNVNDYINPEHCVHGQDQVSDCEKCVREAIEFANQHHTDYVRNNKAPSSEQNRDNRDHSNKNSNTTKDINCVTKNRPKYKKTKKTNRNKNFKNSSSSSSDEDDNHDKNRQKPSKNKNGKKGDPSSEDSSSESVLMSDFDSRRYSNLSSKSSEPKSYKLRSTLKYPRLSKEAGLAPNSYFDRFCTTLQINLEKGSLEDVPCIIITHLLAEMMLAEFAPQREIFKNKCAKAETLDEVRTAFAKALSESNILRERRFEEISSKPKDITWKTFASNLFQIFKNAFPHEKRPLHSKLLILKFKSIIPSQLRRSYELAKVNIKESSPNLFEIAETLDQINSFQVLEGEDKTVFTLNAKLAKDEPVHDNSQNKKGDNSKNINNSDLTEKTSFSRQHNFKKNFDFEERGMNNYNNFINRQNQFQDRYRNQGQNFNFYGQNYPKNTQSRTGGTSGYRDSRFQNSANFRANNAQIYRYNSYPFGVRTNYQNFPFRHRTQNYNPSNNNHNNNDNYHRYQGNNGTYNHPVERRFNTKYRY